MTKTLTEQWRDGTLPEGYYYIRWSFNIDDEPSYMIDFYDREDFVDGAFIYKQRKFIDEVMCVVPSYEEYRELLDLNVYEKDRKKVMGLEDKIKRLQELLSQEEKRIRSLLERVGEADKIIKYYAEKHGKLKACDYLNKWGVK